MQHREDLTLNAVPIPALPQECRFRDKLTRALIENQQV